jgi:hypothetical protein
MEDAIARLFNPRLCVIVPNVSWGFNGLHECDVLIVKKSGYAVEVEIKRSRADLVKDFKKRHGHSDTRIQKLYYAMPETMIEKCIALVPDGCGVISVSRSEPATRRYWNGSNYIEIGQRYVCAHIEREPKWERSQTRKLTVDEQLLVARLGTLRIWTLKRKIIAMQKHGTNERMVST